MTSTADRFLGFADQAEGESSVYAEWARGVAGDVDALRMIDRLPEQKRYPPLVFACARLLGASLSDWSTFRRWMLTRAPALAAVATRRHLQTNEPRRAAAFLPALALVPGPIALIEVGAAGGLTLVPDRYAYRYDGVQLGEASLTLECATEGNPPIPEAMPDIRWRRGIDLTPLDVTASDDARWLELLVWPGQSERLARTRAAIEIVRRDPPPIVAGDAVDALADAVAAVPEGLTPVVLAAGTLVYLPGLRRQAFRDRVRELGCRSITLERVGVLPDLEPDTAPPADLAMACVLTLDDRPLAYASPHGDRLAWL
ncbi:MAG: hypothetical protein JWP66_405 [Naasia sp.]|nr:hypothetical protein [Naasia sp.]